MLFREAVSNDITQMHVVRTAVKENRLSSPEAISVSDYEIFLQTKGKGWVCIMDNSIAGFAIVDAVKNNVWALFVHPVYEGLGIGKQLHNIMLVWYFEQSSKTIWLSTGLNTRAEKFYILQGWKDSGMYNNNERKFTMSYQSWQEKSL